LFAVNKQIKKLYYYITFGSFGTFQEINNDFETSLSSKSGKTINRNKEQQTTQICEHHRPFTDKLSHISRVHLSVADLW
jgi:hypothetical protein